MHTYKITYIFDNCPGELVEYVEGIGLAEAVDTFIDTYCPVVAIVSVILQPAGPAPVNRENRMA